MSKITGNSTATATWRGIRNGRRHKLITRELERRIPSLGATDEVADIDDVLVPVKLFNPYTGWTWYIAELDPETGICFGIVEGLETEVGYFELVELAELTWGIVPAVERDLYWTPRTIGEIGKPNS